MLISTHAADENVVLETIYRETTYQITISRVRGAADIDISDPKNRTIMLMLFNSVIGLRVCCTIYFV